MLFSCKNVTKEKSDQRPNFLINGENIADASSFAGQPDTSVGQAYVITVGEKLELSYDNKLAENGVKALSWDVDDDGVPESKEAFFLYSFKSEGTFTVTLCVNGNSNCISKYVWVVARKKTPTSTATTTTDPKEKDKKNMPDVTIASIPDISGGSDDKPIPPKEPTPPPARPNPTLPGNGGKKIKDSCKPDDALYISGTEVELTPVNMIKLRNLTVYASKNGNVMVRIKGKNLNKSTSVYANKGKSILKLDPDLLLANNPYTISISSDEVQFGNFNDYCLQDLEADNLKVKYTKGNSIFQITFYH